MVSIPATQHGSVFDDALLFLAVTVLPWAGRSLNALAQVVPSPPFSAHPRRKEHFGFNIGDDYCLANYKQLESYWNKLATQTDRLKVVKIGVTEEGRNQLMGIVTSPANHAKLSLYQEIAKQMAHGKIDESLARQLAEEGKAVIWIDGGLHATSTLRGC